MRRPQFFIPEGYPDELLFGIIGRLGRSLGVKRVEQMRDRTGQQMINLSPFGLAGLHWLIDPELYENPEAVVAHYAWNHTPLRYLLPFTRRGLSKLLMTSQASDWNDPLSYTAAMLARNFNFDEHRRSLRWCPECFAAETSATGNPYWHLSHQLPCTAVCATHDCILNTEQVRGNISPRPRGVNDEPHDRPPPKHARPRLLALARADQTVMECAHLGFLGRQVRFAYEDALYVRNRTPAVRRAALRQVQCVLGDEWQDLREVLDFGSIRYQGAPELCDLIDNEHHPKLSSAFHVLLSVSLDIDLSALLSSTVDRESGVFLEDVCGSRFCPSYCANWSEVLQWRSGAYVRDTRGRCSQCSFTADWSVAEGEAHLVDIGTCSLQTVRDLVRDGVATPIHVARVIGVSREIAHDVLSRLDLANASFMSEVGPPATPTHGIDLDVFLGCETGRRA